MKKRQQLKRDAYGRVIHTGPRGGKYITNPITGKKIKPVNPVTKSFLKFLMKKH